MTILYNKLTRAENNKADEVVQIDQQLVKLEDDIRKLKINFDMYFNGALKRPPLEARASLDANLKRILDLRTLSYRQRYQLNTIVSRFSSYRELWRRLLKMRGDELV